MSDQTEGTPKMQYAADIGDSFQNFGDELFTWLPRLIGALVTLLIFSIVAKLVRKLIGKMLPKSGVDRAVKSGKYGEYVTQYASGFTPGKVIAAIAFWFILLTGVILALSTLGIAALTNAIAAIGTRHDRGEAARPLITEFRFRADAGVVTTH